MRKHLWDLTAALLALLLTLGYLWYSGDWRGWNGAAGLPLAQALYVAPRTEVGNDPVDPPAYMASISEVLVLAQVDGILVGGVDWPALARIGKPVRLVFRFSPSLAEEIENKLSAVAWRTGTDMMRVCSTAENEGVNVSGILIDYNAPVGALGEYANFLERMTGRIPNKFSVGITVMPAWLESNYFGPLARSTHSYVLRISGNSAQQPTTESGDMASRLPGWLARADTWEKPYAVELPIPLAHPAYTEPAAVQPLVTAALPELVQALRTSHSPYLRGLVWYPVPAGPEGTIWTDEDLGSVVSPPSKARDASTAVPRP